MAKTEQIEKEKPEVKPEEKSDRQMRWEAFLAKAEKENPEKFAIKKARGEFAVIPATFI